MLAHRRENRGGSSKLSLSANSCGTTCSRGLKTSCVLCPVLLRHAPGITPDDGDDDDEYPFARKRMKIQGVITAFSRGSAADARGRGLLGGTHAGR